MDRTLTVVVLLLSLTACSLLPPSGTDSSLSAGSFTVCDHPSGQMYQYALSQLMSKYPDLTLSQIFKVEEQVVSGMKYRFTFSNGEGNTMQETIYVPLNFNDNSQSSSNLRLDQGNSHVGFWPDITQIFQNTNAQNDPTAAFVIAIKDKYFWAQNMVLVESHTQNINGNQVSVIKLQSHNQEDEATFKVERKDDGSIEVSCEQRLHAKGYSRAQLESLVQLLKRKVPALETYRLFEAKTSSVSSGYGGQLVMNLRSEQKDVKVYLYRKEEQSYLGVYGL